jgi:hypothetical protein
VVPAELDVFAGLERLELRESSGLLTDKRTAEVEKVEEPAIPVESPRRIEALENVRSLEWVGRQARVPVEVVPEGDPTAIPEVETRERVEE